MGESGANFLLGVHRDGDDRLALRVHELTVTAFAAPVFYKACGFQSSNQFTPRHWLSITERWVDVA